MAEIEGQNNARQMLSQNKMLALNNTVAVDSNHVIKGVWPFIWPQNAVWPAKNMCMYFCLFESEFVFKYFRQYVHIDSSLIALGGYKKLLCLILLGSIVTEGARAELYSSQGVWGDLPLVGRWDTAGNSSGAVSSWLLVIWAHSLEQRGQGQ